jgi:hypothetical protein
MIYQVQKPTRENCIKKLKKGLNGVYKTGKIEKEAFGLKQVKKKWKLR